MASFAGRTTLADERRARQAQSQLLTAPRVHEEGYHDSSSDEEDDESFPGDRVVPSTTTLDSGRINSGEAKENSKTKEEKAAALENDYAKEKKKRSHRPKATLKAPLLTDPETGLGRLLHNQPKLSKPNSTIAAASYTRKLFAHYHAAVRDWTSGNAAPNDTQWMHQVERLSSQKVVRDHVESLRQVICRRFVESKVGLEKADRYFEQLATEVATVDPEEVIENTTVPSPEDTESPSRLENTAERHTGQAVRVSPAQATLESDKAAVEEEETEFEIDSPSNKRPLADATGEETAPVSKRRILEDDESDDEEIEFNDYAEIVQNRTTSQDIIKAPSNKRRVLDDESENEAELELGDSEPKPKYKMKLDSPQIEPIDRFAHLEPEAGSSTENPTEAAETWNEQAIDIVTTNKDPSEDAEMQAPFTTGPTGNDLKEKETSVDAFAESNEHEDASDRTLESPSNKSTGRFHVLEELTQGSPGRSQGSPSASGAMTLLGQQSQPMDSQTRQDEDLSETLMTQPSTQDSKPEEPPESPKNHPPILLHEETTNRMSEDTEEIPTQTMGSSPSEQDTVIPSDSSPQEDDTLVPSFSDTQATLIPSPYTGTPTQEE